jgi:DNA-binding MurR/RpiR family transcriptional regulator
MSQAIVQAVTLPDAPLEERVTAHFKDLAPAEQRVARFFVNHREEVAFLSAAEMATQLDTSTATVIRTSQALGYAGLPELKRELSEALRLQASPALRLGRSLEQIGAEPHQALEYTLSLHAELLQSMRRGTAPHAFARAVDLLHAARRVVVYGIGPSASLAEYLNARLRRLGRAAMTMTDTGIVLADALLEVHAGDVVVMITFGRIYREVEVILKHAQSLELPVVLLTDTLGLALADRITVALSAPRGRTGMLPSAATTVLMLDALLLGIAASDRPRALQALEQLNDLRAEIVGYRIDVDQQLYEETAKQGR